MRICANPNCGEPIEGAEIKGRHHICHIYLKMMGRERPAPSSVATSSKKLRKTERTLRAQEYREHLERLQDARLQALMPTTKKKAEK